MTATLTAPVPTVKPRTRKPRPKPVRTIRLLSAGLFQVTEAGKRDLYTVRSIAADFGTAFEVAKIRHADIVGVETDAPYHVNLGGGPRNSHTCECLGHLKHGHKTLCRHVAGLLALAAKGLLS